LWRDRVSIFLGARRIHLVHIRRGLSARPGLELSLPCSRSEGDGWAPAVDALGRALERVAWRGAHASVVVSDHFVRYVVVPTDGGSSREERRALARHLFRATFGERADGWQVSVGMQGRRGETIAAAVEPSLIERLTATLTTAGLVPSAIEPFLAAAFNRCRRAIGEGPAWLAVAEPDRACVAYLAAGRWCAVANRRVARALRAELPGVLEQARLASGLPAEKADVFLVTREPLALDLPRESPWTLRPVPLNGGRVPVRGAEAVA
jgi:hypothetical protein